MGNQSSVVGRQSSGSVVGRWPLVVGQILLIFAVFLPAAVAQQKTFVLSGGKLLTGNDARTARIRGLLTDIAKRNGLMGPAQAAMSFVARHPAKGVPIVGSGKRERVDGAIQAVNTVMDRQDWYAIATETSEMLGGQSRKTASYSAARGARSLPSLRAGFPPGASEPPLPVLSSSRSMLR